VLPRINARTAAWVADMNAFMQENEAPYSMTSWSSFFKLAYPDELPYGGLLFFWLRAKGVHIWDGRICFFTIAHSDEDLAFLARSFKDSVREMQDAGLLPRPKKPRRAEPPVPGARLGKDPNGAPAWFVPDPDRPGKYLRVGAAT